MLSPTLISFDNLHYAKYILRERYFDEEHNKYQQCILTAACKLIGVNNLNMEKKVNAAGRV